MKESKAVRNNPSLPQNVATPDETSLVTITNEIYLIQQGNVWTLEACIANIEAGETYYLIFDASNMTKTLRSFPTRWDTSSSLVIISQGVATSYTGGTDITGNVFNRKSGADSREVDIIWNPAVTGGVFPALPNLFTGGEATRQSAGGGGFQGGLPIILDNDTIYCFKIENPTADDIAYMNVHFDWVEKTVG